MRDGAVFGILTDAFKMGHRVLRSFGNTRGGLRSAPVYESGHYSAGSISAGIHFPGLSLCADSELFL